MWRLIWIGFLAGRFDAPRGSRGDGHVRPDGLEGSFFGGGRPMDFMHPRGWRSWHRHSSLCSSPPVRTGLWFELPWWAYCALYFTVLGIIGQVLLIIKCAYRVCAIYNETKEDWSNSRTRPKEAEREASPSTWLDSPDWGSDSIPSPAPSVPLIKWTPERPPRAELSALAASPRLTSLVTEEQEQILEWSGWSKSTSQRRSMSLNSMNHFHLTLRKF